MLVQIWFALIQIWLVLIQIWVTPVLKKVQTILTIITYTIVEQRLIFGIILAGTNIASSRISKHGEGLAKPKGMKVKEKTVKGSKRPVGGFEKATSKKKKNTNDIVHLEPRGPSTV